jgi:hypothetical protein
VNATTSYSDEVEATLQAASCSVLVYKGSKLELLPLQDGCLALGVQTYDRLCELKGDLRERNISTFPNR